MWFAHIMCLAFWKAFRTRAGVYFGLILNPCRQSFGTIGRTGELQGTLQGSGEGAQRVAGAYGESGTENRRFWGSGLTRGGVSLEGGFGRFWEVLGGGAGSSPPPAPSPLER